MTFATERTSPALFGVSLTGPAHLRMRRRCEDCWHGALFPDGACIAVSDGLGSRPEAARGARSAVHSATRAFREWRRAPGVEPAWCLRLLEARWRLAIAPSRPADCSATCLFAGWTTSTGLVVAGLGDGLVLLRERGKPVQVLLSRSPDQSLNETRSLGADHRLSDWTLFQHHPVSPWALILATDGIADDLAPDKLDAFAAWLLDDLMPLPRVERRARLRSALKSWPTPGHSDDKTIAVLHFP